MIFIPHQLPQPSMYAQYSTLEVDTASATSSTSCPPVFQGEISPPTHMTEEERRMWAKDRQKKDNHNMSECFHGDIFIHPTKVSTEHSWVLFSFFQVVLREVTICHTKSLLRKNHTTWVFRELYMPQKETKIDLLQSLHWAQVVFVFLILLSQVVLRERIICHTCSCRVTTEKDVFVLLSPFVGICHTCSCSHYWERCFCPFISSCWDIL